MTGEEGSKVVINSNSTGETKGIVEIAASGIITREISSNGRSGAEETTTTTGLTVPSVSATATTATATATNISTTKDVALAETSTVTVGCSSISNCKVNELTGEGGVDSEGPLTPLKRNGRTDSAGGQSQKDDASGDSPTLSEEELSSISRDQLVLVYKDITQNFQTLRKESFHLKESEEKMRLQQLESSRRENVLVMRLTTKEQELQEYVAQLNELKSSVAPTPGSLRSTLVDPAVNLIIKRMKKELEETKKKFEDTQNDLNAWKFTPDSNTGKRLMAKCRMLYQENEDLGKMITSGRLAKLESDLALQKSLTDEMKKSQSELDELIQELDEDVEGMQSTIYYLQQQLRESKACSSTVSNALNSSNNIIDEISVVVSELCAHCRATQEEKKRNLTEGHNSSTSPVSTDMALKMELEEQDSNLQNAIDDERTCVNGEINDIHSDKNDSERSRWISTKSLRILDDDSDSRSFVKRRECDTIDADETVTDRSTKEEEMQPDCDQVINSNSSYNSPPAKRTKLANHSSSSTSTQVQNSNENPILANSSIVSNSESTNNRNGCVN